MTHVAEVRPVRLAPGRRPDEQDRHDRHRGGHDAVIKPIPLRPAVPEGFTRDDFAGPHDPPLHRLAEPPHRRQLVNRANVA
jgi:hypothetical protein